MPIWKIVQEELGHDNPKGHPRHRCNNRLCINPDHLELGSRGENLQDERNFAANGVDYDLL
ncbi:HNH endonuclease [Albidovulum sediminis]|uniref:HNH endonuclease n=1 Tax=Albidovulum sediminis TaxID=3066345 RepID=A0ABT2NHF5_9RHOB|nr:HNH endonuclease [Defluviimonas sediminis]MCT8328347.1 HNH endonuclease [Defluviimonas sediminis]